MSPTRRPTRPSSPGPRQGHAVRALPSSSQTQSGGVGDPCRSRDGGAVLRPWRAIDVRRLVPPSDVGDAPALGPGILQLRVVAADDPRTVKVLAVKSGLILRPIHHLADGSYLAKIYKSHYDRKKDRDGIAIRVIRYTLDDPQRVGHGEEHVLITNLFDEDLYPAMELIVLYHGAGRRNRSSTSRRHTRTRGGQPSRHSCGARRQRG